MDDGWRITHLIVQRIEEGLLDEPVRLEEIAAQFELSSRHIRRIMQKEIGISLIQLIQTRRLLLAKQLLTETSLPVTEIAFASGFRSLRRFNDAFNTRYGMPPSRLRKEAVNKVAMPDGGTSILQLNYRPPYDWEGTLHFLAAHTLKGVEHISDTHYARTVCLGKYTGWIRVSHAREKNALQMEFPHVLTPVLSVLLRRIRNLFDLSARPDLIAEQLGKDEQRKVMVDKNPGLRVPGAYDSFELSMRAILGQQVTVKSATTLACRFVNKFGEPLETPFPELTHLSPNPEHIVKAGVDSIAGLGIVSARSKNIIALAESYQSVNLQLEVGMKPECVMKRLFSCLV